jgi:hypothetical protein
VLGLCLVWSSFTFFFHVISLWVCSPCFLLCVNVGFHKTTDDRLFRGRSTFMRKHGPRKVLIFKIHFRFGVLELDSGSLSFRMLLLGVATMTNRIFSLLLLQERVIAQRRHLLYQQISDANGLPLAMEPIPFGDLSALQIMCH